MWLKLTVVSLSSEDRVELVNVNSVRQICESKEKLSRMLWLNDDEWICVRESLDELWRALQLH